MITHVAVLGALHWKNEHKLLVWSGTELEGQSFSLFQK
jgi:hypothetical protein